MMQFFSRLHRWLLQTEIFLLVMFFLSLVLIAVAQIIMRNFFASGIVWAESYVRIVVLWLAMIGAMLASHNDQHIAIDVLLKKMSVTSALWVKRVTSLFTAVICFIIAWHSFGFVLDEYEYGGVAFASVPNWLCEAIIPVSFFIIALRYLLAVWMFAPSHES
jgi:TRAP-type C4-dicarboxylate transport system permease small subunit